MIISLNWLKKYVDIPVDTQTFVHDLTMLGLNVEHCTMSGFDEPLVVVGLVVECEKHPDADKLSVCRVNVGSGETLEIVCGAPNVAAGQKVPVALVGAKLSGGLKIRKSKIRGVRSNGMICSAIELGTGEDAAGILVLDDALEVGTPFGEVIGEGDAILEIEVTPNRPDQLSHTGVAREVAARYSGEVRLPGREIQSQHEGSPSFTVEIDDPEDCYRFTGRVIRGVKVGPSPAWLRESLQAIGLNTINNVVDIGNYVMMEMGQPLHAYDLKLLSGRRMGVRRSRNGEKILALDGVEYELVEACLLITNEDEPVGVAGVIGGALSAVNGETTDVLIESAAFNPRVIRASRKALNISTDASYRFERGSDREVCMRASDRAAELILEIAGGVAGEAVDAFPAPWPERIVSIRRSNTRRLLGISITIEEIAALLERLHFEITATDEDAVTVRVPSWRADIVEEADLVEEVARLYGYDRIGQGWKFRTTSFGTTDPFTEFIDQSESHLCARGHTQIFVTSFTDGSEVERLGFDPADRRSRPIALRNPLTANHSFMRTSLIPGVLDVIRHNIDHGNRRIRVFSTGAVFLPPLEQSGGLPDEPTHLLIAHSRPAGADFWDDSKQRVDLFDIKREIESIAALHHVDLRSRLDYQFDAPTGELRYRDREKTVIQGGIVRPEMARALDLDQPIWYAELDMAALFELRPPRVSHRALSEYPASRRDLSLLTPVSVPYDRVEKALVKNGGRLLESLQVFDVYQGDKLPDHTTAIGVRLWFRSSEATLTDEEVDAIVDRMVGKLDSELGVVLRS